jgi:hypothetical protein
LFPDYPRSGTTLFASFSGKRRIQPHGLTFREAEQRFLLLFLEKEE